MSSPPAERPPLARLALVLWTVMLTACGLAIVAAVCAICIPPLPHDPAFAAHYAVLDGFLYSGQPAKTAAFQACVLAAPFLLFAAVFTGRCLIARLDAPALRRWIKIALALHLLFFAACIRPIFYDPHPPLWLTPRWLLVPMPFPPPVAGWEWIVCVLLAVALAFATISGLFLRREIHWIVIALALICAPVEFYAPSQITDDTAFTYHLNAMMDALSQSVNGHHLLVDFPHIYGGYGEMLALVLRFLPRTMAVPLAALALPTLLGLACTLASAFRLVRNPAVLALVAFGLLGVTYLSAVPPNYCYSTPRLLFPALGLFLSSTYFRRPGPALFWLVSAVAAFASIWNLDTGLVVWCAWTLTLLAGDAANRAWKIAALRLVGQVSCLLAAWALFFLYLRLASHHWPGVGLLFYFQSMVVKTGYFCVALIVPGSWSPVVLLYLTGLSVAALAHLRRRVPWKGRVVLMFSLTGIGVFSYYLGRSAESNLISVSPPGILLAGLLGSEMLARARRSLLPPITRWFFLPWAVMIFWWGFLFFVQLPVIAEREARLANAAIHPGPNQVQINADFAARHVQPGESGVYFLSGHSGFYYYLTGTTHPLHTPGNVELIQMRDMQSLIDAIHAGQIPKLFVEENFWTMDMYRRDVYDTLRTEIAAHYQPGAVNPDGQLQFLVPRP